MKKLNLFIAVVLLAAMAVPGVADQGSRENYATTISHNETTLDGDRLGDVRFRQEKLVINPGDTTNGQYKLTTIQTYKYVQAASEWVQGDLLVADTTVRADTGNVRLRKVDATTDTGSVVRTVLALGSNACDTNNYCWVLVNGVDSNQTIVDNGVGQGEFLVPATDAGSLTVYAGTSASVPTIFSLSNANGGDVAIVKIVSPF